VAQQAVTLARPPSFSHSLKEETGALKFSAALEVRNPATGRNMFASIVNIRKIIQLKHTLLIELYDTRNDDTNRVQKLFNTIHACCF
jgi:hypothetical protein